MKTATMAAVVGLLALLAWGSCRRQAPKVGEQPPRIWLASAPPKAPAARAPLAVPRPKAQPPPRPRAVVPRDSFQRVRPAPEGFVPAAGSAFKLTLVPEAPFVSRGRSFWYRLELQNAGRAPVLWRETHSFFEDGFLQNSDVQFFLTQPDGQTVRMLPPTDDPGRSEASAIEVTLNPGETLVSRPWAYQGRSGAGGVWGPFRELASRYQFSFLGTYEIKAVLQRSEVGRLESEPVRFEVVP